MNTPRSCEVKSHTLTCDECGKFIPWRDLYEGTATRRLLTPSSHFTCEEYETLCRRHAPVRAALLRRTEELQGYVVHRELVCELEAALAEAMEVPGFEQHGGLV